MRNDLKKDTTMRLLLDVNMCIENAFPDHRRKADKYTEKMYRLIFHLISAKLLY